MGIRYSVLATAAAVALLGLVSRPFAAVTAWAALMLVPGWALYALLERRRSAVESLAAAVVLSPVLTCGGAVLFGVAGMAPAISWKPVAALAGAAGVAAVYAAIGAGSGETNRSPARNALTVRQWAILGACTVGTLALAGYLPLAHEWWRFRSDAWFHRAVVAQIESAGLPPEDPYFAGFELQYMWFYHVLVLALSRATHLDPFRVMTLVNLHALCGLFLATWLFAGVFARDFAHRLWSCLVVAFGLNGLFWLFLPLKAVRAVLGEVRGMEELSRTFAFPQDITSASQFLTVYFNPDFLLDKFVVATAVGLALCCTGAFWYASAEYLRSRRPVVLAWAGLALVGMLGFHTVFGVVMSAAAGGGLGAAALLQPRRGGRRPRAALELAAALVLSAAVVSPYLYSITHTKESAYVVPFALSFGKVAGIAISCAGVIALAAAQRVFFTGGELPQRYVRYAIATTVAVCTVIVLPDSNTYDKLPLFVFYPLAVIGGWTIADFVARRRSAAGRAAVAAAAAALFLAPVNAISFYAYSRQPTSPMYTRDEAAVAAWVRGQTFRDAVFIDRDEEVFLLVGGPRRYYCGRRAYARQWGYDKAAIAERLHARDVVLGPGPVDLTTLRALGEAPWELYAIDRRASHCGGSALSRHPELFEKVFSAGGMDVYLVDSAACAGAAAHYRWHGVEETPKEELLRESGL